MYIVQYVFTNICICKIYIFSALISCSKNWTYMRKYMFRRRSIHLAVQWPIHTPPPIQHFTIKMFVVAIRNKCTVSKI